MTKQQILRNFAATLWPRDEVFAWQARTPTEERASITVESERVENGRDLLPDDVIERIRSATGALPMAVCFEDAAYSDLGERYVRASVTVRLCPVNWDQMGWRP